ncbi:hypothetical protein D3C71_1433580 [compost metagenome]
MDLRAWSLGTREAGLHQRSRAAVIGCNPGPAVPAPLHRRAAVEAHHANIASAQPDHRAVADHSVPGDFPPDQTGLPVDAGSAVRRRPLHLRQSIRLRRSHSAADRGPAALPVPLTLLPGGGSGRTPGDGGVGADHACHGLSLQRDRSRNPAQIPALSAAGAAEAPHSGPE